ncbi:MAG: DUF933 domain-containing protein [Polyangia bacterium]|jgi:GTP-binding protein YchF|nr:DUF933 domain-containing protein [Polyangia bacterium]
MKIGLFGFAGSGKTTVFNLLTGLAADTSPGAGSKGKANLGVTRVPDPRVDFLAKVFEPKKTTYAEIHFADMPGQAPSKTSGGLSPQVVGDLRPLDVLALVLRAFESPMLDSKPDPLRDFEAMEAELMLADQPLVEKRLERLRKEKGPEQEREREALERCLEHLEAEKPLRTLDLRDDQWQALRGFRFLSQKRLLVLLNTPESAPAAPFPALEERLAAAGIPLMKLSATVEAEIQELEAGDRAAFLADLGLAETGRERFIRLAYGALDLISFLTSGPDECRAWTIPRGMTAQPAAGRIHSDLERGFIRAEVIGFEDFQRYGSEAKAKAAGRYRLEGKDYVVQDGDILNIRFNV